MAYQQNFKDEEENKQDGQQGTEQVLAGQSSQMSTQPSAGPSQSGKPQSQRSSGAWTNLQSYVDANAGNDAAMANKIRSGIESRANEASTAGAAYKGQADRDIEAGTVRDDGIIRQVGEDPVGIINNIWPSYSSRGQQQGVTDQSTAGAVASTLNGMNSTDPTRREQFDKQWDAYYTGPNNATEVQGYADTGAKYKKVDDRAQTAQSYEGTQALLRDEYDRSNYTQGENQLDAFIMGAGQQGRQVLDDINQTYSGFSKGWDDIVNQVNAGAAEGKRVTDETREGTRQATGDNITRHKDSYSAAADQAAQAAEAEAAAYAEAIKGNNYGAMGVDPAIAKWLAGLGVGVDRYVGQAEARKAGDFTTPEEEAAYNALIDLGRTPNDTQDYTRTGRAADDIFDINDQVYGAGSTAYKIYTSNEAEAAAKNSERAQEVGYVRSLLENPVANKDALYKWAAGRGITKEQIDLAISNGIDISRFLEEGSNWDVADAADNADRSTWNEIIALLNSYGFNLGGDALNDNTVRGDAYTFDKDGFLKALPPIVTNQGGTLGIPHKSSGGYVEQQRRNAEDSAIGQTLEKASPTKQLGGR